MVCIHEDDKCTTKHTMSERDYRYMRFLIKRSHRKLNATTGGVSAQQPKPLIITMGTPKTREGAEGSRNRAGLGTIPGGSARRILRVSSESMKCCRRHSRCIVALVISEVQKNKMAGAVSHTRGNRGNIFIFIELLRRTAIRAKFQNFESERSEDRPHVCTYLLSTSGGDCQVRVT